MNYTFKNFYEWKQWEAISHHVLLFLSIYIIYLFKNKLQRTTQNLLLFAILVALMTLIHQNINNRNNVSTSYNDFDLSN